MAVDSLVDKTKLNNSLSYEADRIRLKTGGSADIAFDFANEKGFGDAIDAIPTWGGGSPTATFSATPASTDATLSFDAGDYTIPSQYALFVKSDVTSSDGANFCIIGGFHTKQNTVPILNTGLTRLGRYFGYKASSGTDYYDTGNSSQNYLTKSGTTLNLKFNNNHKFKAGGTYTIQIIELDATFFNG